MHNTPRMPIFSVQETHHLTSLVRKCSQLVDLMPILKMNTKRWTQIQSLFEQVLEKDPATRDQFLKIKCANDADLYQEITSLLAADENVHHLLDGLAIETIIPIEELSLEGETVGNYKVSRKIASGGMGAVYLAHRSDGHFDRSVVISDQDQKQTQSFC